ncbi:hypothetical protein [Streptomyces sp. RerS4]|uniref:hypothetical protein n=1 Tax=Streptomyces sp. RerS4 TaxID=2942449 RepID=UPI00201C3B72|nr:hypothetical protein [Streptomyces sp. RerS4]UQX04415.1 hypothetical protein M4D82_30850 [Streptomyces sp. RerS4]
MDRSVLPYLYHYRALLPRQRDREPVGPRDGHVRVFEHHPEVHFLDGGRPVGRAAPFFLVWTPGPRDGAGNLVPCAPSTCRRWVEAGLAYAATVDDVSGEVTAAHRLATSVPWWQPLAARRALRDWLATRERYERVMREATEAYEPIGREIRQAVQAEKDKAAERAREVARREAEARRRRERLAERSIWGWSVPTGSPRTAYVFRHDVPRADGPVSAPGEETPAVALAELRRQLKELEPDDLRWDGAALAETERELEGVSFGRWWRELFYEDHLTFTSPPPPPSRGSHRFGGTGYGGSGGFSGGHSCGYGGGY